jgi:hypothetical protein
MQRLCNAAFGSVEEGFTPALNVSVTGGADIPWKRDVSVD